MASRSTGDFAGCGVNIIDLWESFLLKGRALPRFSAALTNVISKWTIEMDIHGLLYCP